MTHSRYDPSAHNRVPWNFGAKIGPHRPPNRKQVGAIRFFLDREKRIRDRVLSDLSIDSRLRDCDLVALQIGVLVVGLEVRKRATIAQQKAGQVSLRLQQMPDLICVPGLSQRRRGG